MGARRTSDQGRDEEMTAFRRWTGLTAAILSATALASAQTAVPRPEAAVEPSKNSADYKGLEAARAKLYARVFEERARRQAQPPRPPDGQVPGEPPRAAQPAIPAEVPSAELMDCAIKVFRPETAVDPKFIVRAPADTERFKLRRIPTPCK